jgi:hypothetical protein
MARCRARQSALVSRKGAEYLYRKYGKLERSLGRRSPATEAIMNEQSRIRNRLRQTGARLKTMARVNGALYLNRVPRDAAMVLRELDSTRLLGKHLFVIGTHALYAYEMKAGVLFESSLLATSDFDARWRLRLVVTGVAPEGVLGVLKKADPTHSTADNYGVRAQNANGYCVDLFCPDAEPVPSRLAPGDLDLGPIDRGDRDRMEWDSPVHAMRRSANLRSSQAVAVEAAQPPGTKPTRRCRAGARCRCRFHRISPSQIF